MNRRRASAIVAAVALWGLPAAVPVANAGDHTLAEALFRDGKALMNAGDYKRACPKLSESYNQDPSATGTLLALGLCHETDGRLASAWTTYSELAARAHEQGNVDRERVARERVARLTKRLSKVAIKVPAEVAALPGLTVKRDGHQVAPVGWGDALPADGGVHLVEVTAIGRLPWSQSVTLAESNDERVVEVPMLTVAPVTPPTTVAPDARASMATAPELVGSAPLSGPDADQGPAALRGAGVITAAVGVVGLGVGTVFGFRARSDNRASNAEGRCVRNACDAVGYDLRQDAVDNASLATAFFIGGGVLVAGGATLFLLSRRRPSAFRPGTIAPLVTSSGGGGLVWSGGFP